MIQRLLTAARLAALADTLDDLGLSRNVRNWVIGLQTDDPTRLPSVLSYLRNHPNASLAEVQRAPQVGRVVPKGELELREHEALIFEPAPPKLQTWLKKLARIFRKKKDTARYSVLTDNVPAWITWYDSQGVGFDIMSYDPILLVDRLKSRLQEAVIWEAIEGMLPPPDALLGWLDHWFLVADDQTYQGMLKLGHYLPEWWADVNLGIEESLTLTRHDQPFTEKGDGVMEAARDRFTVKYHDTYPLRQLPGQCTLHEVGLDDLVAEGKLMWHCLGDGGYAKGETRIFSIRDSDGRPVSTMEYLVDDEAFEQIVGYADYEVAASLERTVEAAQQWVMENIWAHQGV